VTTDGEGHHVISSGSRSLGAKQTASDAEVSVIEAVVDWYQFSPFRYMVIHSDSTSAIARAQHPGAGPGQAQAVNIHHVVGSLLAF